MQRQIMYKKQEMLCDKIDDRDFYSASGCFVFAFCAVEACCLALLLCEYISCNTSTFIMSALDFFFMWSYLFYLFIFSFAFWNKQNCISQVCCVVVCELTRLCMCMLICEMAKNIIFFGQCNFNNFFFFEIFKFSHTHKPRIC